MLKYPRRAGAILVLLAAGVFYESIVQPIRQAAARTPEIRISVLGGTVALALAVLGLIYVVVGARFARIFQPSAEESKAPAFIVGGLLAGMGLVIYWALKSYLQGKGYVATT
jgi:hypothetical protein